MSSASGPAPPREVTSHPAVAATIDELADVAADNLLIARAAETDDEMVARALVSICAAQQLLARIELERLALAHERHDRLDHVDAMQRALVDQLAEFSRQNEQHHTEALRRFAPPTGVVHELAGLINELLAEHDVDTSRRAALLADILDAIGIEPPPAPLELATAGRCTVCGCTEDRSCAGGCSWENAERTLCTRCASAERRGHPRGTDPIADAVADLPATTPRMTP